MPQTLAVVPIFMSAGAAVLPTVLAALASVAAILFKPRELFRICRAHPAAAGSTILCIVAAVSGSWWFFSDSHNRSAHAASAQAASQQIDWAKVGADIIARENAGTPPTPLTGSPAPPQMLVAANPPPTMHVADQPPAENPASLPATTQDFSRCNTDNSPAPLHLKPLWRFQPDGGAMFLARPAAFGNTLYVAGAMSGLGGSAGLLAALDLETGKPIWQITGLPPADAQRLHEDPDSIPAFFSSPAITPDGKSLIIGQGLHNDANCSLLCFDTTTHALRWSVATPLHIESSPAIFKDIAVVGAGAIEGPDGRAQGDPGFVFGVRISDGKELWKQPLNDPESSPAIDDDGMAFIGSGFNGQAVAAIRTDPDETLAAKKLPRLAWKTPVDFPATGTITIAGDLIILGTGNGDVVHSTEHPQGAVYALDKKTGQIRWRTLTGDSVLGSLACRDNTVICPCRTGEILALDLSTGKILWRSSPSGNSAILAGVSFAGKNIYAVSSDGYLAILDASTGKILEPKTPLNDPKDPGTGLSSCPPQVVKSRIIAGSETGGIECLISPPPSPAAPTPGAP